jgi:hypothetical protein
MTSRSEVSLTLPRLPFPPSFPKNDQFRDFLLTKRSPSLHSSPYYYYYYFVVPAHLFVTIRSRFGRLPSVVLNAERGALQAPVFATKLARTRKQLLADLAQDYHVKV